MTASEEKNRESVRAFVDREAFRDDRAWMLQHYEQRLSELMEKGAHRTHPWITDRYEADILNMSKHAKGDTNEYE